MSVRKSLLWSYGAQLSTFFITFGTTVVVARLLSPRDVGIYAAAAAILGIVATFTSFGVANHVIREVEVSRQTLRACNTVNAALALSLAATIFGLSVIPGLFQDDIRFVLMITALNPIVGAFEFAPWAMTMREGRFGLYSSLSMLRNSINAVLTLAFAFCGFGAASLALGSLAGVATSVVGYILARPKDVVIKPTFRDLRPIISFGFQMVTVSGATQMAARLSELMLSRLLGLTALGLYTRASNLSNQISSNVYGIASNVLFSKMSEELRTTGSLRRVYLRALAIITALVWPMVAGIAVLARPLVATLYGEKWLGAAAPLTLLMIALFISVGIGMSWELFVLRKETARQVRIELARAVIGTTVFVIGATVSLTFATVGRVVEAALGYLLYRGHLDRLADLAPGELSNIFTQSALLTLVTVAPSAALMLWTNWSAHTNPAHVICAVLIGGVCWCGLLAYQGHPLFQEVERLLVRLKGSGLIRRV